MILKNLFQTQIVRLTLVFVASMISYTVGAEVGASVRAHPETVVAVMDANVTASFHCEVEGTGLEWYVNGTDAQDFYGADFNTNIILLNGGVTFSSNLTISTAEEFDNLQIVCRAEGGTKEEAVDSNEAWLRLEAPLVTPHNIDIRYDTDLISLTWTCGIAEHVELHYNVTISRDDLVDIEDSTEVMQAHETFITFGLDHPFAELCTNYTFSVIAWSVLDTSDPSETVTAGFYCPTVTPTGTVALSNTASTSVNIRPSSTSATSSEGYPRNQDRYLSTIVGVIVSIVAIIAITAILIIMIPLILRRRGTFYLARAVVNKKSDVEHQWSVQGEKQHETDNNSSPACDLTKSQDPVYDVTSHVTAKLGPALGVNIDDPNYQKLGRSDSEKTNDSTIMAPPGTQGLYYAQVCLNKAQHGGALPHAPPPTDNPVDYVIIKVEEK